MQLKLPKVGIPKYFKNTDWGIVLPALTLITSIYLSITKDKLPPQKLINTDGAQGILNDPLHLPYKLLELVGQNIPLRDHLHNQLPTFILGLAGIYCIYYLLSTRFSRWLSISFATLYGLLPWVGIVSAHGTLESLMLWPIFIVYYLDKLMLRPGNDSIELPILTLLIGVGLSIPGINILLLVLAVLYFRPVKSFLQSFKLGPLLVSALIFLGSVFPIIYAYLKNNLNIERILGISQNLDLGSLAKGFLDQFSLLFWHNSSSTLLSLGDLALFNVSMITFIFAGLYYLYFKNRKQFNSLVIISVSVALAGSVTNIGYFSTILVPLYVYIAAQGLKFALDEWFRVFPINPFAKYIAIAMVSSFILINVWYDIHYTHFAWPNYPPVLQSMLK